MNKATAEVHVSALDQTYDCTPKHVTVTTVPADLPAGVTYDGSTEEPRDAGSYTVVATVNDVNYTGLRRATLVIQPAGTTITDISLAAISPNTFVQYSDTVEVQAKVNANQTASGDGKFSGTVTFRIDITDKAIGGQTDMYGFTAYRKDGTVFHQAYMPASGALKQTGTKASTNQILLGGERDRPSEVDGKERVAGSVIR